LEIHVVTAFPNTFSGPLSASIVKRAIESGLVRIFLHDIREYATDKHKQIDDYPYGGGPGMILKPEPIFRCFDMLFSNYDLKRENVILMSPLGQPFTQKKAVELSVRDNIVLLCGHYKGIDERIRRNLVAEEISIGDFITTGGEMPAMTIIDSVVRLLPGAIGDFDSADTDSFQSGLLDHPHYTRPEIFRRMAVPKVLLSGNHAEIEKWRQTQRLARTKRNRRDLYNQYLEDNKTSEYGRQ
jgi:tRNA (guanine37-N1)-methyltransferase